MDEKELIKQAKSGDNTALANLLQQNYSFLVKYLIKVTLQPSLAEDLAQETMMKCLEKIHLYNGTSKFSTWLISIATNLYIDDRRKKKREQRWKEQEQSLRKSCWHVEQRNEEWLDVIDTLHQLHDDIRIPIILKHHYGYSYEEISKVMNIAIGTVKSRIHNGLSTVRKELTISEKR